MSEQIAHPSEIPSPPLDLDQKLKIKQHPLPANVLKGMREDMAKRKASADPGLSDKEVLTRLILIGMYKDTEQDQKQAAASAIRDFVKVVLSFLAESDAAKALQFHVFIPICPPSTKPDEILDEKGQKLLAESTSQRSPGTSSSKGEEIEKAESTENPPPTISFSDALALITPLWPNLIPHTISETHTALAEATTQEAIRKAPHILPLTAHLFHEIMSQERPLPNENDIEIWQSVQNLLHLYLSPLVPTLSSPTAFAKAQQFAIARAGILMHGLKTYAQEHPYKFAGHLALTVVSFFPGIILTPVLGLFGFGASGVAAGSAAARLQASYAGGIPAGSVFSMCQSYAMGGRVGVALGTGVSAAASAAARAMGWFFSGEGTAEEPSAEEDSKEEGASADEV